MPNPVSLVSSVVPSPLVSNSSAMETSLNNYKKNEEDFRDVDSDVLSEMTLHLKRNEEASFKAYQEKESAVILKIKEIFEAKLRYKKDVLEEIYSSSNPVDVYIKAYMSEKIFLSQTKHDRNKIREELQNQDFAKTINNEITWMNTILEKIKENVPYLPECIYMDVYMSYESEKARNDLCPYKMLNEAIKDAPFILRLLFPFLSKEFHCFSKLIKDLPASRSRVSTLSADEVEKNNMMVCYLIPNEAKKVFTLADIINKKIKDLNFPYRGLQNFENIIKKCVNEAKALEIINRQSWNELGLPDSLKKIDVVFTPYWEDLRAGFRSLYYCIEELNELLHTVSELEKLKPSSPTQSIEPQKVPLAVPLSPLIEIVPKISDIAMPPPKKRAGITQEDTDEFLSRKKIQLELWQRCIEQRKKRLIHKEVPLEPILETMTSYQAQILLEIDKKIGKNRPLFESFFKADFSCKPHTLAFQDIELFIKRLGGSIDDSGGSSHFSIRLPNTYLNASPAIMGGSYKPHGTRETWNLSAHQGCRDALKKAGITPDRIEEARAIMASLEPLKDTDSKTRFKV